MIPRGWSYSWAITAGLAGSLAYWWALTTCRLLSCKKRTTKHSTIAMPRMRMRVAISARRLGGGSGGGGRRRRRCRRRGRRAALHKEVLGDSDVADEVASLPERRLLDSVLHFAQKRSGTVRRDARLLHDVRLHTQKVALATLIYDDLPLVELHEVGRVDIPVHKGPGADGQTSQHDHEEDDAQSEAPTGAAYEIRHPASLTLRSLGRPGPAQ